MRWVVSTTAVPAALTSRIRSKTTLRECGSSPAEGSSRKSTSGPPARAAARLTRWRCPPDRRRMVVPSNSSMPSRRIRASMSTGSSYIEATWCSRGTGRIAWGSPPSWSMMPTRARSCGPARHGSSPSRRTVPELGRTRPWAQDSVVVLPAPLVPSRAVTAPARALRLTPSTAHTVRPPRVRREPAAGNSLRSRCTSTAGCSSARGPGAVSAGATAVGVDPWFGTVPVYGPRRESRGISGPAPPPSGPCGRVARGKVCLTGSPGTNKHILWLCIP